MKIYFTGSALVVAMALQAQPTDSLVKADLDAVVIKAFERSGQLRDVPAAVNFIGKRALERFSAASIVQAINTTPGVRMEERSPGSYRLNIRGSSLRSPFGVRNVKVYFNDLPYTDPAGNSYLNTIPYYLFSSIEIIKGPGSSLYGAGTGGVVLIESMDALEPNGMAVTYLAGSYGLQGVTATATTGNTDEKNKIGFQHLQSDGYRDQSALKRNNISWTGRFATGHGLLKTTVLYSHLFYQTPGALTKTEFSANPRLSRPAGGGFPGAAQAQAAINQKTALAGLSYQHRFASNFSNTTSAYGMFTDFRNPAIRNYGKNTEPHTGARTSFFYQKQIAAATLHLVAGGELQQNFTSAGVYKNKNGEADSLQVLDDISVRQSIFLFQAVLNVKRWEFSGGASLNYLGLSFKRQAPAPLPRQQRNFSNEVAPRFSVAKKFTAFTIYSSVAKGFSPPAATELLPSGSAINLELNAERGTNYEIGFRGVVKRLSIDVNAFRFGLQNTIVQRRDAGGGELFINAGKTAQHGIETALTYSIFKNQSLISNGLIWLSHTWHQFRYKEFKQLTSDFSGRSLPGTAPHTLSTGIDVKWSNGFATNLAYMFSSRIALNDGNTEYAAEYHLLNARLGYELPIKKKLLFKLSAGVENLLNQTYSLGNDINAFGGRYYNAAPGRNFYLSLAMQLHIAEDKN